MDKISVIVPVYNVKEYLDKCIDSILNQTYKNIEIILIDDGSTDGSEKICDIYASNYKNIKVFHIPNGGVSNARNLGLETATGEWIAFVDADDYIIPDMYEILINNAYKFNVPISVCGYRVIDKYTDFINSDFGNIEIKLSFNDSLANLLDYNGIYGWVLWNKIFKREIINNLKFNTKITNYEDLVFLYSLFSLNSSISTVMCDKKKYYYYVRKNSASHKENLDDKDFLCIKICKTIYENVKKIHNEEGVILLAYKVYQHAIECFILKTLTVYNSKNAKYFNKIKREYKYIIKNYVCYSFKDYTKLFIIKMPYKIATTLWKFRVLIKKYI